MEHGVPEWDFLIEGVDFPKDLCRKNEKQNGDLKSNGNLDFQSNLDQAGQVKKDKGEKPKEASLIIVQEELSDDT